MNKKQTQGMGGSGAKKKVNYGQYLTLCIGALVVPMLVIYVFIGINSMNNAKNFTIEATLPGTATLAAAAIEVTDGSEADMENVLNSANVSATAGAAVVDKTGKVIASSGSYAAEAGSQAAVTSRAATGDTGIETVKLDGSSYQVAFAPVADSEGEFVVITVPNADFNALYKRTSITYIIVTVLLGFYAAWGIRRGSSYTSIPLHICIDRLTTMSEGDFSTEIPDLEAHFQEILDIKECMEKMRADTHEVISDIEYTLGEMSIGNFTVSSRIPQRYVGDYSDVLTAENRIKDELTRTLEEILQISEQVSAGSEQVSNGAQSLAQGATEQASSIDQLSESITRIAEQINDSAREADRANRLTGESGEIMQSSAEAMAQASAAMDEISETSRNISKVIKAIDDIAFQTNILALNAAVEAARAGSAGKGFAVVADEVRNLSQKSAEAAKNTTTLIESSYTAVEKGGKLVSRASDDFAQVAEKSAEVSDIVANLSAQFQQQAAETTQISNGIQQVAAVVQMNSATSEESAAASEELSSQANVLKGLVAQFRLTDAD